MQISSLLDIVGGKLLNTPSISFITQAHTTPSKINDGDLFIVFEKEDVQLAIDNGAFAILYSFDLDITDTEVAWIKVNDVEQAAMKLLRFMLSTKEIKGFSCDDISFELINILYSTNKELILLSNNIKTDFELLKDISNTQKVFSTNTAYLNTIYPSYKVLTIAKHKIKNLIKHSLFNTTFSYNGKLFYKLKLSSMYIDVFLTIIEYFNQDIDTNKLKNLKYFNPIFINNDFEITSFGKSNRFILANDNINLIEQEIGFLQSNYSYAKIIIISKYKNEIDLFTQIKDLDFNALYVVGKSNDDIKFLLDNHQ